MELAMSRVSYAETLEPRDVLCIIVYAYCLRTRCQDGCEFDIPAGEIEHIAGAVTVCGDNAIPDTVLNTAPGGMPNAKHVFFNFEDGTSITVGWTDDIKFGANFTDFMMSGSPKKIIGSLGVEKKLAGLIRQGEKIIERAIEDCKNGSFSPKYER
jgi:hypothetical protein